MKKFCLLLIFVCFSHVATAGEVEIPLFEDDTPRLGRNAEPLKSLVITPSPLPDISIDLDTSRAVQPASNAATKTKTEQKTDALTQRALDIQINPPRTAPIALAKNAEESSDVLMKQIEEETKRIQAETPTAAPSSEQPALKKAASAQAQLTPRSLEGLFGQTHDVHKFNISGFSLGLQPEEVFEIADLMGYQITKIEHGIPLFKTSFYEQRCRDQKIHVLTQLRSCVVEQAREEETEYVSSVTMKRPASKEYIQILFTSNATDNVAYKIYYENEGDNSLTMTQKNLAKQLRRKEAFWNLMFETYGLPDDNELLIWGDPQKSYMQATMQGSAYNAYIVLEDKDIQDDDYFKAEAESKELIYNMPFSFQMLPED